MRQRVPGEGRKLAGMPRCNGLGDDFGQNKEQYSEHGGKQPDPSLAEQLRGVCTSKRRAHRY